MLAVEPSNEAVRKAAIDEYAATNPEKALGLIEAALKETPGDVELTRTKWLLLLRMTKYKQAMDAGEELVKLNPASATQDYYDRQVGAAQSDSNNAKIIEFAQKASEKFPKQTSYLLLLAQTYRKQSQLPQALQAARKAADIDPKESRAWLLAIFTAKDMNQPDTALAIAKAAAAAGTDRQQLESALLQILAPVVKKAQDSKERADWEAALAASQTVNVAVPSPASHFYVGLASFQVGLDALQNAQKLGGEKGKDAKESKAKACAEAKVAEEMWANATIAMTSGGGGTYNKEGATSVMAAIQQYGVYIPDMKKAYCGTKS
jgi:tetratricopeptide (TPR) repeat protein